MWYSLSIKKIKSKNIAAQVWLTDGGYSQKVEITRCSGTSFLLIYHQLAFSSNLLQFTQNKKTRTLLNNNVYKIKDIHYSNFWKCPYRRVRSIAASRLSKNSPPDCFCLYEAVPYLPTLTARKTGWLTLREVRAMNFDRFIAVVAW